MENPKDTEKDHFILYLVIATIAMVGTLILVKLNENEKFAPIKAQLDEENRLMNIRVLGNREE